MIEILDLVQGSPEWFQARLGIATASEFGSVLAKGRGGKGDGLTRRSYMLRLAAERLTGKPVETYSNHHMQRGKDLEAEARDYYAFVYDQAPQLVGFIRNGEAEVGCSPDAFLDDDGILEIKTRLPALIVDAWTRDDAPPEFIPQVQGALWVCERNWVDLVCYWPGLPMRVFRVERDEDYIASLANEVARFNDELYALVKHVRHGGTMLLREQLEQSAAQ